MEGLFPLFSVTGRLRQFPAASHTTREKVHGLVGSWLYSEVQCIMGNGHMGTPTKCNNIHTLGLIISYVRDC